MIDKICKYVLLTHFFRALLYFIFVTAGSIAFLFFFGFFLGDRWEFKKGILGYFIVMILLLILIIIKTLSVNRLYYTGKNIEGQIDEIIIFGDVFYKLDKCIEIITDLKKDMYQNAIKLRAIKFHYEFDGIVYYHTLYFKGLKYSKYNFLLKNCIYLTIGVTNKKSYLLRELIDAL
ncbi:hypothetical protein FACS1894130_00190 [Spirochaetia bacterium]|nr:hypothetical protein FACS1894130_00190 [Spirochaetia bacterium]